MNIDVNVFQRKAASKIITMLYILEIIIAARGSSVDLYEPPTRQIFIKVMFKGVSCA